MLGFERAAFVAELVLKVCVILATFLIASYFLAKDVALSTVE